MVNYSCVYSAYLSHSHAVTCLRVVKLEIGLTSMTGSTGLAITDRQISVSSIIVVISIHKFLILERHSMFLAGTLPR